MTDETRVWFTANGQSDKGASLQITQGVVKLQILPDMKYSSYYYKCKQSYMPQ